MTSHSATDIHKHIRALPFWWIYPQIDQDLTTEIYTHKEIGDLTSWDIAETTQIPKIPRHKATNTTQTHLGIITIRDERLQTLDTAMKRSETLHTETYMDKQIRDFLLWDIHPETDQSPHALGNTPTNRPWHTPRKTDLHSSVQQQNRSETLHSRKYTTQQTRELTPWDIYQQGAQRLFTMGHTCPKRSDTYIIGHTATNILENSHYATPPKKNTGQRPHSLGHMNTEVSESSYPWHIPMKRDLTYWDIYRDREIWDLILGHIPRNRWQISHCGTYTHKEFKELTYGELYPQTI